MTLRSRELRGLRNTCRRYTGGDIASFPMLSISSFNLLHKPHHEPRESNVFRRFAVLRTGGMPLLQRSEEAETW